MRSHIVLRELRVWKDIVLRFGQDKKRTDRQVEIVRHVPGVFGNAHNFVLAGSAHLRPAEMFSDRVLTLEKFPDKRLVDDRHMPRSLDIAFGNRPASKNGIPDNFEVSPGHAIE